MPNSHVPRNTGWSWSALVAEFGTEGALHLLPQMPGLGQAAWGHRPPVTVEPAPVGSWDEVHVVPGLPTPTVAEALVALTNYEPLFKNVRPWLYRDRVPAR